MRSNCHVEAWRAYRRGEAAALCLHPTRYSRLAALVQHPLAWPVRLLGAAMQWLGWPLVQLGHTLRDGRWLHVSWIDAQGRAWEFVPHAPKRPRCAPPLVFAGHVRRVADVAGGRGAGIGGDPGDR